MPVESEPESPSPIKKSKTKSPSKKPGPFGPIPASLVEASAEDKMIVQLKETEGKTWAEIRKALEDFTGLMIGSSTPHVRYARMKANFVVFGVEDVGILHSPDDGRFWLTLTGTRLLQKKKEIEERFEIEKWQKIADGIEEMGGGKYPSAAVQKKYKELAKNGNSVVVMEE